MQKCHSCGGPLGEDDIRHRHGNCAPCRSLIGTVAGLDAAIRADGDNPERFGPEWEEIRGLLRKLAGDRNDLEAWKEARCRLRAEGHRYFLTWPLPKLAEWLRAKALSAEGKPQGDGQHAAPADTVPQPKRALPPMPPREAWAAYYLRGCGDGLGQEQIAKRLSERGMEMSQATVSRKLAAVDAFLQAGGLAPNPEELAAPDPRKAVTMDSAILDMGKREDGRTPGQRGKMVDPADD